MRDLTHSVAALTAALSLLVTLPAAAQATDPQKVAIAQGLFEQAAAAMEKKDFAAACPKLEEVVRLVPDGLGAQLTLAECYEGAGRLATAWASYLQLEAAAARTNQDARRKTAHDKAEELRPKLARLVIVVPDAVRALPGIAVERDGVPVGSVQWGVPILVDKGTHKVIATATGKQRWEKTIDVRSNGVTETVTVEATADAPVVATAPLPGASTPVPPPTLNPNAAPTPDAVTPPPSLSHKWQPGAIVRADIAVIDAGVRTAVGLTFGVLDNFEVSVAALIGRDMGVEPEVRWFILKGALKPYISAGAPLFFTDGVHAGLHGAGGLQWDPIRRFGVFAQIGGVYFPSVPAGFTNGTLLPSVGVQGRL